MNYFVALSVETILSGDIFKARRVRNLDVSTKNRHRTFSLCPVFILKERIKGRLNIKQETQKNGQESKRQNQLFFNKPSLSWIPHRPCGTSDNTLCIPTPVINTTRVHGDVIRESFKRHSSCCCTDDGTSQSLTLARRRSHSKGLFDGRVYSRISSFVPPVQGTLGVCGTRVKLLSLGGGWVIKHAGVIIRWILLV